MSEQAAIDPAEATEDRTAKVKSIYEALAAAQGEFPPLKKNRTAKVKSKRTQAEFEYSYCTLDEIFAVVRPVLAKHKLSLRHTIELPNSPSVRAGAGRDVPPSVEMVLFVEAILTHSSGEELRSGALPVPNFDGDMQAIGSGLTYARRYTATAVLGICAEEDDDAHGTPANPFRRGAPAADQPARGSRAGNKRQQAAPPADNAPAAEAPPDDPFVVAQKAFVLSKTHDKFEANLAKIETSEKLAADLPLMNRILHFAAKELARRCQSAAGWKADDPATGALEDHIKSIAGVLGEKGQDVTAILGAA